MLQLIIVIQDILSKFVKEKIRNRTIMVKILRENIFIIIVMFLILVPPSQNICVNKARQETMSAMKDFKIAAYQLLYCIS